VRSGTREQRITGASRLISESVPEIGSSTSFCLVKERKVEIGRDNRVAGFPENSGELVSGERPEEALPCCRVCIYSMTIPLTVIGEIDDTEPYLTTVPDNPAHAKIRQAT